jgi:hypothetical protein
MVVLFSPLVDCHVEMPLGVNTNVSAGVKRRFKIELSDLSACGLNDALREPLSLGTNPPVLSQYMLSTWWFHVQNTNTFLNQNMLSSFRIH